MEQNIQLPSIVSMREAHKRSILLEKETELLFTSIE